MSVLSRCSAIEGERVDGAPIRAIDLDHVNPNDVYPVDILRDAASTAIYGVRGANGVILITTKPPR